MQNDCFLSSYSDFCLEDLTLPSPQHTDQSPSIKLDSNSVGGQQDYEEIIFVNETPSITAAATGAPYPPVQRVRRRTTVEERQYLENIYAVNKKPDSDLRKQIAQKLQWPEKSVRIWFQNCRYG
ncbi:hypothetical protein BKA69DRAFT_124512 [Paraphysoderma sedebokerense]|nr:hypothetical protein BKA69DRAFT_124512 [Paraphysoderma sedebokerense]